MGQFQRDAKVATVSLELPGGAATRPRSDAGLGEMAASGPVMERIEQLADTFALGQPTTEPVAVSGGLSNEMWRVVTDRGAFAAKRMIANAERPEFARNIEAAFDVEQRAWAAGVPMARPVPNPATGGALAQVGDRLFRVHHWVDGQVGTGSAHEAIGLLAGSSPDGLLPTAAGSTTTRSIEPIRRQVRPRWP